jgi:hypothetical protein
MSLRCKNGASWANMEVHLFGRPKEAGVEAVRELLPAPPHEVPDPLPEGVAVCVKETRDISDRAQVAACATLVGTAGQAPPLATVALAGASQAAGVCSTRLMCRVDVQSREVLAYRTRLN